MNLCGCGQPPVMLTEVIKQRKRGRKETMEALTAIVPFIVGVVLLLTVLWLLIRPKNH
jgi:hypothetical protein